MARPKADLGSLAMPKEAPAAAAATPASTPAGQEPSGYAHTLSLRMTAEEYRRLRRYVAAEEDRTGRRATHQAIIMAALAAFLDGEGA
jgi:hypothetical protein